MVDGKIRAVLDTNILVSASLYGGKPRKIIDLLIEERFTAIISPVLFAELQEVLKKKFKFSDEKLAQVEAEIDDIFQFVHPEVAVDIQKDKDDNRVLEAALDGRCDFIVTGDIELLNLKIFRGIRILTPSEFLALYEKAA